MEKNMKYTEQNNFEQEATSTRNKYSILKNSSYRPKAIEKTSTTTTTTTASKKKTKTRTRTKTTNHDNPHRKIAGSDKDSDRNGDPDRDSNRDRDRDRERDREHSKEFAASSATKPDPSQLQDRLSCLCEW